MGKKIFLGFLLLLGLTISACKSIRIGGTGKVKGVRGSGEIRIPMPEQVK